MSEGLSDVIHLNILVRLWEFAHGSSTRPVPLELPRLPVHARPPSADKKS